MIPSAVPQISLHTGASHCHCLFLLLLYFSPRATYLFLLGWPSLATKMGEEKWTCQGRGGEGNLEIQSLIFAFQPGKDLNPVNLKVLYAQLLLHLSSSSSLLFKKQDILYLSHVLFTEVDKRFNGRIFSVLLDDVSLSPSHATTLLLLLRCCLLLLILIAFDHHLLLQRAQLLLSVLAKLFSISTHLLNGNGNTSTQQCTASTNQELFVTISLLELEPSHPSYSFLRAMLEVFAAELLAHKSLREYFILIDSTSPRSDMLFISRFGHANIGCVLEVLCAHFILSLSHARAFEDFPNRLIWCHGDHFGIPQISPPSILSLLLNPIILSAPKLFQAYLLLLVSDALGICMPAENMKPDLSLMDCYSTAFERSFIFYTRQMCSLHFDGHALGGNASSVNSCLLGSNSQVTFESLLRPATRGKLHRLIAKSNHAWASYLNNMHFGADCDLVAVSIAYLKKSLHIFDESHKNEVLSILSCLVVRGSSDCGSSVLHQNRERTPEDIFLLASTLKLMSSSLLQAIWYVGRVRSSCCLKSLEDVSSCKEYDAIMDIVSRFEQFTIHLPIQKFLCEIMQSHPARHKSQGMLLHFSGLLSLSYASGFDFLVKDCLFTLLTLFSLFIIEEGDLRALGSLFNSSSKSFSSKSSDNTERALPTRKSSQRVSSKIRKIQDMYLRTPSLVCSRKRKPHKEAEASESCSILNSMDSSACIINTEKTCNGEIFLKCILGRHSKLSDLDDLADFIECRPGKDYSGWLRNRQRFRLWKYKKTAILRWKKKKMSWNYMKGR